MTSTTLSGLRLRTALGLILAATAPSVAPAKTEQQTVEVLRPGSFLREWKWDDWHAWALANGLCIALEEYPLERPFRFWGFVQYPDGRLTMSFGTVENARPQILQLTFNNGNKFPYEASVWPTEMGDAYTVPIQSSRSPKLRAFPENISVDAFADGQHIFGNTYNGMSRLKDRMEECSAFQAAR